MQMGTKARRQADALPSPEAIDVKRTALLLDVDGTLLDIAATPYSVVVPPSLRKILSGLIELSGGAVALVSGRTIETLDGLFAPLTAPAIGGHGAEIRSLSPRSKVAMAPTDDHGTASAANSPARASRSARPCRGQATFHSGAL